MKAPLLFAVALLLSPAAPLAYADSTETSGLSAELPLPIVRPPLLNLSVPEPVVDDKPTAKPSADAVAQAALAKIGWKSIDDGALVRLAGPEKGYIPGNYLGEAQIEWKSGRLSFTGGDEIDPKLLPMILDGIWIFVSAGKAPPAKAGRTLAAWGLPPVIDGRKLVNPDGSATYFGQMLALLYSEKPAALKRASAERLSQALDLLTHARDQAFGHQAADVAKTDVDRAKLMLFAPPREGETPFAIKPYKDLGSQLKGFETKLESDRDAAAREGDAVREKDSASALDVLNTLERQHYHAKMDLPAVPKPGQPAPTNSDAAEEDPRAPAKAPLSSGLPLVLRALDRINGKPLTPAQQENLIKSFPMGDLVWRMGAQNLWRQGLTGKDVKVAVIDGGIGHHDELEAAVKSRANFTADRGKALTDEHGTHVAGIIHALAPDAQINGYAVFDGDGGNPALKEGSDKAVLRAIDKAVKDGNRIISMSLGGDGSPSDVVARKVEQYADQGVIFVVAAGNEHDKNGVTSPAVAPNAITVGALDDAGRPADFSSYGTSYDARKLVHVVKSVFMAPGTNVYSTVVEDGKSGYMLMDGTSMATPAVSGVAALLTQAATAMTPNPVTLSARVRDALVEGSQPLSLDKLPSNVPFDQPFLVVQPMAALDALRRDAAQATAGSPKKSPVGTN